MRAYFHHGLTKHPLYKAWKGMHDRCGARGPTRYSGIRVCARWRDFSKFLQDMGDRPPGHTLDRKKNHLGYSPANCRWATPKQQSRNTRFNTKIRGKTIAEWSEVTEMPAYVLVRRLQARWRWEDAISYPVRRGVRPQKLRRKPLI
jgi:hypothetical protein